MKNNGNKEEKMSIFRDLAFYITCIIFIINLLPLLKINLPFLNDSQTIGRIGNLLLPILTYVSIHYLKYTFPNSQRRKNFPESSKLLYNNKEGILTTISHLSKNEKLLKNNDIDISICPQLRMITEVINGNQPLQFAPDDEYIKQLYDDNVRFIVAITGENPHLWMDPTNMFYLANCYASSITRKINSRIPNSTNKVKVGDGHPYQHCKIALNKIQSISKVKDIPNLVFEFMRFFIIKDTDIKENRSSILPSLITSQHLFNILPYVITNDDIDENIIRKNNTIILNQFKNTISNRYLMTPEIKKAIDKRIQDNIVEFLILFFDSSIKIHSYLNKTPFSLNVNYNSQEAKSILILLKHLSNKALEKHFQPDISKYHNRIIVQ